MTVFNLELCTNMKLKMKFHVKKPKTQLQPPKIRQRTRYSSKNWETENTDFETVNPPSKRKCVGPSRDKNLTIINEIRNGRVERTALLRELTKKPQVIPLEEKCEMRSCNFNVF
ncbi:hypothetical protein QE152_g6136 [Popillia japonica]|uniref:Uncharacterized protein n=1 Tax=Popillia japonica TaxID=7064 RepID=A0AAW1MK01_POPJA